MAYNSDSRGGARSERPEGRSGGFGGGAGRPGADAAGGDAAGGRKVFFRRRKSTTKM